MATTRGSASLTAAMRISSIPRIREKTTTAASRLPSYRMMQSEKEILEMVHRTNLRTFDPSLMYSATEDHTGV